MIKIRLKLNLEKELAKEVQKIKQTKMDILVKALKDATPVDTGRARDGWYHDKTLIRNDVNYVEELNQGTSKQAPVHFIERTLLSEPDIKSVGVVVKHTR